MLVNFVKMKASARAVVLALAFAVFSCAASFAQDAPKSRQPDSGQTPAKVQAGQTPAKVEGAIDPDKKLVQDRWGYSTGEAAKKVEKKGRPVKSKPATD